MNYLREFREHLVVAEGSAGMREFGGQAMQFRLRRIAARPERSAAVA